MRAVPPCLRPLRQVNAVPGNGHSGVTTGGTGMPLGNAVLPAASSSFEYSMRKKVLFGSRIVWAGFAFSGKELYGDEKKGDKKSGRFVNRK